MRPVYTCSFGIGSKEFSPIANGEKYNSHAMEGLRNAWRCTGRLQ